MTSADKTRGYAAGTMGEARAPRMMDQAKLVIGALAVAGLLAFFFQNTQEIEINFLWMEWNVGAIWALLASAVVGAIAAFAFSTIRRRSAQRAAPRS